MKTVTNANELTMAEIDEFRNALDLANKDSAANLEMLQKLSDVNSEMSQLGLMADKDGLTKIKSTLSGLTNKATLSISKEDLEFKKNKATRIGLKF